MAVAQKPKPLPSPERLFCCPAPASAPPARPLRRPLPLRPALMPMTRFCPQPPCRCPAAARAGAAAPALPTLVRWPNLLMMLLCLALVRAGLLLPGLPLRQALLAPRFGLLVLAALLVAAAGYIINDYYDVKIDAINRPDRLVVGRVVRRRVAMLAHLVLSGAGRAAGRLAAPGAGGRHAGHGAAAVGLLGAVQAPGAGGQRSALPPSRRRWCCCPSCNCSWPATTAAPCGPTRWRLPAHGGARNCEGRGRYARRCPARLPHPAAGVGRGAHQVGGGRFSGLPGAAHAGRRAGCWRAGTGRWGCGCCCWCCCPWPSWPACWSAPTAAATSATSARWCKAIMLAGVLSMALAGSYSGEW